jgi:predicted ATPase
MIKAFKVQNLNKKYNFDFQFNNDLNIFTGKNGSGKTTLLKTMWYVLSGNLKEILSNVYIDNFLLRTENEELELKLYKGQQKSKSFFRLDSLLDPKNNIKKVQNLPILKDFLAEMPLLQQESAFFSTFRRNEGGFISEKTDFKPDELEFVQMFSKLNALISGNSGRSLSNAKHQFVESISTRDIVNLLTQKYTDISTEISKIEKQQSDFILQSIAKSSGYEKDILFKIKNRQQETNSKKEILLKPFTILSELIRSIFEDKGIKITDNLSLGDTTTAISSDKLSAGEKQMLSFLCYCMFVQDTVIFIDEPELSLHPDWQRLLMPTLLEIAPTNQFFIATHSPFIYAKYPDKEIILDNILHWN